MTNRDLSALKTSSILFVGGFLFMSALALLGSAGAALGSPPASDGGAGQEPRLAWAAGAHAHPLGGVPSVDCEAEPSPFDPLAPR